MEQEYAGYVVFNMMLRVMAASIAPVVAIVLVCAVTPSPTQHTSSLFGLYVYPNKAQDQSKQATDEAECYTSATQKSGVDPANLPSPTPAPQGTRQGGTLRGGARGAAAGAALGAIAGNAGQGAAIGAAAGGMSGYAQQKRMNEAEQHYAQANTQQQQSQKMNNFRRAYSACLESKGYTVR